MNSLIRTVLCIGVISLPFNASAYDNPTTVLGSEEFSKQECIDTNTNDCIESICMTSTALDCTQQCKQDAIDKCEDLADQ